jgi:catechol 2,3-dioxygenase-like lactoylglutathione lyase family enzyme
MPVTRLDHLVLTVADLEATLAWYGAVAGMQHVAFGDARHALRFGDQKINLHVQGHEIEPHAVRPTAGSGDLCFIVDESPEELQARLDALGIAIELGPVARDGALGTVTSSYLRDPDGNLVELSSYPERDEGGDHLRRVGGELT